VKTAYQSQRCLIPLGQSAGWEAGLLDHYQAVVRSICAKLAGGATLAHGADRIGGSTYSFDVGPGHPHAERVYALLAEHRRSLSALWNEVSEFNKRQTPRAAPDRVTFYFGQMVTSEAEHSGDEDGEAT
jgi:hypothetical protein